MNVISFLSRAQTPRPLRAPRRCAALPWNSRSASVQPEKARSGGRAAAERSYFKARPFKIWKYRRPMPEAAAARETLPP